MSFIPFRSIVKYALGLFLFGAGQISIAASADDPAALLRSSVDEILSIAYSGRSTGTLPERVRPALDKCCAFDLITREAMGPGWRQFSANDQRRVTDLFSQLLIRTYAARVVGTQRPKVTFGSPTSLAPDRCEIPTQVTTSTSNEPVAVSYRMVKLPVGWRIYDMIIEGVSFVANYRAQFDQIIEQGGAPAVIRALQSKLAAPEVSHS
jgi:phospholipid transport system substrate-binding protein